MNMLRHLFSNMLIAAILTSILVACSPAQDVSSQPADVINEIRKSLELPDLPLEFVENTSMANSPSGAGDPYGLQLPNPAADFLFRYERHEFFFVPYLRFAILRWGGFPGLDGSGIQFEPLDTLLADLEPF